MMQETINSVKSRSSTPQQEYVRPGLAETLHLLEKWNLLELQNIFKDHDITLRSLIYLTDEEICELIPKIGLRTIFRALLKEWRQTYNAITVHCPIESNSSLEEDNGDNDSFLDQIELKTECTSEDFEMDNYSKEKSPSSYANNLEYTPSSEQSLNNEEDIKSSFRDPNSLNSPKQQKSYNGERFNVLDILKRNTDGQAALEYYKINKFMDMKNRKRIVNILIREVVERKVDKYTAIFHDMTRQLLALFPTEKYESYFVPHCGPHSARGALYYRYSNYTRQLRKEGLLAYKKHKAKYDNK